MYHVARIVSSAAWDQSGFPLAPRLFSFPFFSTTPSLFLSLFPGKLRGNRQILGSEPSLRLVWAQNQPNFRPNRQNAGNFAENPCIPGNYPATAWVFCRFPQFCLRFCPRPALRLRENSEFPEWSTKHPLFSLEISGNAKCWGPSVFLFVFRKTLYRPRAARGRGVAVGERSIPSPFAKGPWFEGISRTVPCVAGALAAWSSFEAIYTPHLTLEVANRCERAACSTRGALVSTWSPMRAAGG